jgi:hypothetical protein
MTVEEFVAFAEYLSSMVRVVEQARKHLEQPDVETLAVLRATVQWLDRDAAKVKA